MKNKKELIQLINSIENEKFINWLLKFVKSLISIPNK